MLLVPSPKPEPEPEPSVADSDTTPDHGETTIGPGDSPRKAVAPTGPDAQSEFSRPQFAGDDDQLAEIEREQDFGGPQGCVAENTGAGSTSRTAYGLRGERRDGDGGARRCTHVAGRWSDSEACVPGHWKVDRGYDTRHCVKDMGDLGVTPQCAQMA